MSTTANCYLIGGTRVLTQCAARLLDSGVRIEGILSDDPAVTEWADTRGIPVLDPHADLARTLSARPFDYLFSMVNFRILPAPVLDLPNIAAINFHDGPLPRYSGSHVPAWALYEGASRHAATWHRMTEAVDAGGVLLERWFPIRDHSTALSLTYETAEVGIELFADLVPHVVARTLPEPLDTGDRERRFYRRSDRMASGGIIHAGTSAAEAERLSKALDYGSFPNPLGVTTLVTEQGAVFTRQVRLIPREDTRTGTTVQSVTTSAITLAAPDADLVLSDWTAVDGSALSGQAAAQRLGITPGAPLPAASEQRLADIAAAQKALRPHEPWWRARLERLRPAPLPADDFSAAAAHYSRHELAFTPASREEAVAVVRAFLTVVAERTGEHVFDFAWSPSAARDLSERTHGIAAARFPVRFDGDTTRSLQDKLDEAAAHQGYAGDLELRLGLAGRPLGSDEPSFTRVMVLDRGAGEEASSEPHTEIALLCLKDGPPTIFVRETAMDADAALDFTEEVEDRVLTALLHGEEPNPAPRAEGGPDVRSDEHHAQPTEALPDTADAPAAPGTLLDLFAAVAADRPGATAVRSGVRTLDYAGLDAWADAVAARLHDEGIESGSVVAVLMERDVALLPALLGILRAGAAFLPLDPGYPVDRLRRYVEVSRCDLIVTDDRTHALGASLGPAWRIPGPDGSAQAVPPKVTASDLAYLLFTSGSTGNPKGVEVEHGALANFLTGIGERLGVSPDDSVLAHTTVAFDISLLELFLPLTSGATVVLASREIAADPYRLAELTAEVTVAQATPSLWRLLLGTGWTPAERLTVLSGGEALPPATAERLHTAARALWNLYGPTEATIWTSCHPVTSVGSFVPLGEPLPHTELHVLDGQLEPCAAGSTGELYLSGAGLARGYAGRPDLTNDVFTLHPLTGVRLYRTGDEVRLHTDGAIEWLGRTDAQVKVRGNRIEPAEIERVLEKADGITAAVVVAARFEGRGEPRLTAYLVGEGTPVKARLDAFVGAALPGYMVPDAYVNLDAMPLTDNGKVARARLPLPTRDTIIPTAAGSAETQVEPVEPLPSLESVEPSTTPTTAPTAPTAAPMTTEALADSIAAMFAATLDLPSFDVHANFFDLGGDSVNVTSAAVRLSRELGADITAPSIFASGTPVKLARLLGAEGVVPLLGGPETEGPVTTAPESARPEPLATEPATSERVATASARPAPVVAAVSAPAEPTRPAAADGALAVIGMACRFPGAATPDEFWQNLVDGVSSVGHAPDGKRGWAHLWSETGADDVRMGWVDGVEYFDAARFGLTDREARRMDPLQRILLSVTAEALESGGHDHTSLGAATGVFVGAIASDFPELVARSIGHDDPHVATGTAPSMLANRLSHVFDWSGPSFAVDTACSSSLVALHQAAMHLRAGDVDAAVVGAANLVLTPAKTRSFVRNGMLSPQGTCRAFDDGADGYVRGEGAGAVILKRLADAERDGDPVLAVIRGTAVNHTGGSAGFLTAPSRPAQEAVLRKALAGSGRTAADIGYIEAHGTGTQLGDLIELEALHAVLGGPAGRRPVAVGSVKTNIGHLEPAAGIAGLIKTILTLQAGHIPPSLNFSTPNTSFDFDGSPLFVADRPRPWGSGPRVAGVSSFGFGGANAHVVVEAGPATAPERDEPGPRLLVLSAGSDEALRTLAHRLVLMLRSSYCPSLDALSEASRQRPAGAHRLACVADSVEQLEDKVRLFLAGVADTRSLHVGVASRAARTHDESLDAGASRPALDAAARAFVDGADLPAGPLRLAGVRFPTRPHAEKYLWLEPAEQPNAAVPNAAVPNAAEQPNAVVPNVTVRDAVPGRTRNTWTEHPEAAEHVVLGKPTLPGACYPGKIAELLGRDRFGLRDLTFRAAVETPATLTAERDNDTIAFRDGTGALVANTEVTAPEQSLLTAPPSADGFTPVALGAMYEAFERAGLGYGAGFRTVTSLSVAPGQATGVLRGVGRPTGAVDARLLDGAFQVALAACGAQGLYVPFTVERLTVLGRLPDTARVYARRDRDSGPDSGLLTASLVVLDGDEPVLEARGITWKRLSPAPSQGGAGGDARDGHRPAPVPARNPGAVSTAVSNGHRPGPAPDRPTAGGLDATLARWVAAALELDVDTLETDRPLQEQGLDSMLAVSLAQDIRAKLGVDIPVTLVLEVGTVDRLAAELRDEYGVTAAPADGSAPGAGDAPRAPVHEERAEPVPAPAPVPVPVVQPIQALAAADGQHPGAPVTDDADRHDIAVIGFDGVFPNAESTEELWRVLVDGEDCLTEVPESRWDIDAYYGTDGEPGTVYLRRAGFVQGLAEFDPGFFRLSPAEAAWIDPQQRHLVQSAWRALEDAGLAGKPQRSTGVFVGASYQHYRDTVVGDVVQTAAGLGNHNAILANRVSYFLDLHGPSMTIDTLCSSSLVALHTAVRSIRDGECDQAVVAGVHLAMSPQYFQLGSRLRSFSPSNALRPFDAGADGFVPGEGVVTVVVKPLRAALRDGDRIRGVIKGSAVNHGGRTSGLTVPSSAAQQEVISAALRDAGVSVDSIGLVEAHGTGTGLGDPIEVEGLTRAWRGVTDRSQFCAIGSLKGNVGHLEPAAGLAGLVKVLLAMEHGMVPPSLHVVRPNDHIRFEETPFYLADRAVEWPRNGEPRRAAVSAFGMGGVNAHVIVEEPPVIPGREVLSQDSFVVRVSGADESALRSLAGVYAGELVGASAEVLGDFAFSANVGRAGHRFRAVVAGVDSGAVVAGLRDVVGGRAAVSRKGGVAVPNVFMFTGQGSQYVGMGRGLYVTEPVFRAALDECAELLVGHLDVPLLDVLFGGVGGGLDRTRYAQVGIVSVQVGLVRWLESVGVRADAVVGHSLGELTAAWASGVLGLADLLRLTVLRGELMEGQPGRGAMAVVHGDVGVVVEALVGFPGVEVAAFNGPRVVTVSGPADLVAAFCSGSGLRTSPLVVSHAFHSVLMEGAVGPFVEAVAGVGLSAPVIGFVSSVSGGWHSAGSVVDPGYWGRAIREPVRFGEAVATVSGLGAGVVWEVGSHPQLTSLARASWGGAQPVWLSTLRRDRVDQVEVHGALAAYVNATSADLDWSGVHAGKGQRTITLPTYPFNRQELIVPAARRSGAATSTVGHPLFDRHYEHRSEGQ
ncbi:amino acid adenylation domain-containing protein [Streptomyces sp. NBC_00513]|uniref:polyketide synthase n=1 Tax=unclassified Streptomyces TaxID=2593676 RepID=UPI00224ED15C|nr:polyketide synthase [Streptomyces sp. NBC_00424]MCX5071918.1 amino acid adenylation domain-containing protein [Streptomyces sp. NBC_00424]WUD44709.1 amino acid adenylation domain-containing protein [Streptomyces sp. NBC_00513]